MMIEYKVYALPFLVNDSEDVFGVASDTGNFVFKGSYHECCDFIDIFDKVGQVFYDILDDKFYSQLFD